MSSDAPSNSQEGRFRSFGLKSRASVNAATGSVKKAGKQARKLVKPRPVPKEQTTKSRDNPSRSTRLSPFSWISNRIRKAASKSTAASLNVPPSIDEHATSRRPTIYRPTSTPDDSSSGLSQISVYFPHAPSQSPDVEHPPNDDSDKSKGSNTSIEAIELVPTYPSIQISQSPSSSPSTSPSRPSQSRPRVPSKAAKRLGSIPSLNAASSFSSLYESQRSSQPPPPKPQVEVEVKAELVNTKPFPTPLTLTPKPAITSLHTFFHSSTSTSISQLITNRIHHAATKPSSSSDRSESSLSIDGLSSRRVTIRRVVSFASSISGLSQISFYFPNVHTKTLDGLAADGQEDDGSEWEKEKESEVFLEAVELFEIFTSIQMPSPSPERVSSDEVEVEESVESQANQPPEPSLNTTPASSQEPKPQEKVPEPSPSATTPLPPSIFPLSSLTHTPTSLSHIFLSPPHLLPLRPLPLPHSDWSPFKFIPFHPFLPLTSRYSTTGTHLGFGLVRRTGEVANSRRWYRFGLVPYLVPVRREVHEIGLVRREGCITRVHVLPRLGARDVVASRARFGSSSLTATGTAPTKSIFTPVGAASSASSTQVKAKKKRAKKPRRTPEPGDAVKPYIQKIANAAAVLTFIATPALKLLVG